MGKRHSYFWYLSLRQRGLPYRGCYTVNGTAWTTPPVVVEYTTGGALNSGAPVVTCPKDAEGKLEPINMLNFSWGLSPDGTKNVLTAMTAYHYGKQVAGTARSTATATARYRWPLLRVPSRRLRECVMVEGRSALADSPSQAAPHQAGHVARLSRAGLQRASTDRGHRLNQHAGGDHIGTGIP